MKKIIRRRDYLDQSGLQELHPVLQKVYSARGITTQQDLIRDFSVLADYKKLKNIEAAAALVYEAIKANKKIVIVGDFDADGATSSALAVLALRKMGAKRIDYLVPNRFTDGYGLTPDIAKLAHDEFEAELIITVDNGIASFDGVEVAKDLGMQVLVTDHHLAAETLPVADVILNPNQPGDEFPSKSLAGVGVVFYLLLCLRRYMQDKKWFESHNQSPPNMAQFLDLVALGTVADVVPLDTNNRILVQQGLLRIRAGYCRPGIKALLKVSGRDIVNCGSNDFGFAVAPRLNAAGRLRDMSLGIECLLCEDEELAMQYAVELHELNFERRTVENEMKEDAFNYLKKLQKQCDSQKQLPVGLCLFEENWHQGVIGVLAGRLKDHYHRPVITFAVSENDELKGSARSVNSVHIRDVLADINVAHPGLILKFGGHAMAAGLSIKKSDFERFSDIFRAEVGNHLAEEDICGEVLSDGDLEETELNIPFAKIIREAGPWGQTFPEPIFDGEFEVVNQRLLGGKHLRLSLRLPRGNMQFDAVAFNVKEGEWPNERCKRIRAAYHLDINEYNNRKRFQLIIEHLEAVLVPVQTVEPCIND